jgi:hypothetical protein
MSPPVSTLLLTWTMACLNGGMARATLAMKTKPASTAAGRIQATPLGRRGRGPVAAWAGTCAVPPCGSNLNRGHGTAPAGRNESAHAQ